MDGSLIDDDCKLYGVRTLVLVGRTGNGKSATGNTIIGRKGFKSRASPSAVTRTSELQQTVLSDGQMVNVIDTPGLFDTNIEASLINEQIVKCIHLAKDGIHALLLVFSVRARFSEEEEAAIRTLTTLFGDGILNYMIVVFTGGDELEEHEETLEEYLGRACPKGPKDILLLCENRKVLFDNKTKDKEKRSEQVQQLLSLVNTVVNQNGGKPYTNELFVEMKKSATKLHEQQEVMESLKGCPKSEILKFEEHMRGSNEKQLKRIAEMVEERFGEATKRLEQKLTEEQAARLKAEERAHEAQMKSNDVIRKLGESLEKARKETDEVRKQAAVNKCRIL